MRSTADAHVGERHRIVQMLERRVQKAARLLRVAEARADRAAAPRSARSPAPPRASRRRLRRRASASHRGPTVGISGGLPRSLSPHGGHRRTQRTRRTRRRTTMTIQRSQYTVIGAAMQVHSALGAGMLESAYASLLAHELQSHGLHFEHQVTLPVVYSGIRSCRLPHRFHCRELPDRGNQMRWNDFFPSTTHNCSLICD